jgi:hypothetical protein
MALTQQMLAIIGVVALVPLFGWFWWLGAPSALPQRRRWPRRERSTRRCPEARVEQIVHRKLTVIEACLATTRWGWKWQTGLGQNICGHQLRPVTLR